MPRHRALLTSNTPGTTACRARRAEAPPIPIAVLADCGSASGPTIAYTSPSNTGPPNGPKGLPRITNVIVRSSCSA